MWNSQGQKGHIPFMLENSQSPFSLEQSLTQSMDRVDELGTFLCTAAQNLEAGGSTFIVIPCNTAHVHIGKVREAVKVPVLSITEEVARELQRRGIEKVAILGTHVTKTSGIYDKDCRALGIETLYPTEGDQKTIERIIQRALSWQNDETDTRELLAVIERVLASGAQMVVLACTDLQLCMPEEYPKRVMDSMQTLSRASVEYLRKFSKGE